MSIQSITNQISSIDREILNLERQIQTFDNRISSKQKEVQRILDKINREKDFSRIIRYQKDLTRKNEGITRIEKQKTSKSDRLSKKQIRKYDLIEQLRKETKKETDKTKKEQQELLSIQKKISDEMRRQKSIIGPSTKRLEVVQQSSQERFDIFISHAYEDKTEVAVPLAELLIEKDIKVWLDDFELKIGDSLRRKIDHGLSNSRFGIVILSESFFKKEWPQKELDGLTAKESDGEKVILPIWHKVSKNEVLKFSPILADKKALNTSSFTLKEIAENISRLFSTT